MVTNLLIESSYFQGEKVNLAPLECYPLQKLLFYFYCVLITFFFLLHYNINRQGYVE